MFNFQHFHDTLISKGKSELLNEYHSLSYLYMILFQETDIEDIEFNAFSLDDIEYLLDDINMDIDYIGDGSGEEELLIKDQHWFGLIDNMENVIRSLNNIPKVKPKSLYKFI